MPDSLKFLNCKLAQISHYLIGEPLKGTTSEKNIQKLVLTHFTQLLSLLANGKLNKQADLLKNIKSFEVPTTDSFALSITCFFSSAKKEDPAAKYQNHLRDLEYLLSYQSDITVDIQKEVAAFFVSAISQAAGKAKDKTQHLFSLLEYACKETENNTNTQNKASSGWFSG